MEEEKYQNLIELFQNKENVEFEYPFKLEKGYSYYADIYVKEECKLPNGKVIPSSTIIEIKERLLFDTLSRYKKLFEENKENGKSVISTSFTKKAVSHSRLSDNIPTGIFRYTQ